MVGLATDGEYPHAATAGRSPVAPTVGRIIDLDLALAPVDLGALPEFGELLGDLGVELRLGFWHGNYDTVDPWAPSRIS
jgi:hypothetical protein